GREGLRLIEEQSFDIIISDLIMDGVGGLEILAKAKRELPDAEVVILTGHGTIKTAVTAMQIAPTSASVLITGESGTGKELVAKALHNNSPRRYKPFVALNCAALSDNILESELFGHVKGAFTGADRERKGWFEHANGGTMFLDEVGDIPLGTQVKLLRTLENGEIVRVGTNEPVKVNVRLISATNRDLAEGIASGAFRQDLYHRLKVVSVKLPPLRERREDIDLLIDHFLKEYTAVHGKRITSITPAARKLLRHYSWPGNVRELQSVLQQALLRATDSVLLASHLPDDLLESTRASRASVDHLMVGTLAELERRAIQECLIQTGGNRQRAAGRLGISTRTLLRKIQEYKLEDPLHPAAWPNG
ncbi:hypothetical protein HK102_009213, partial [Quaeritorhiza haematococci]